MKSSSICAHKNFSFNFNFMFKIIPNPELIFRSLGLSACESTLLLTSDGALKSWNFSTHKFIQTMFFSGYRLSKLFIVADGMLGVVRTSSGSAEVYGLGSTAVLIT